MEATELDVTIENLGIYDHSCFQPKSVAQAVSDRKLEDLQANAMGKEQRTEAPARCQQNCQRLCSRFA
jgi:hypothetical protein